MRQSSQTKTGLVEVFPEGREQVSSLHREHCLTLSYFCLWNSVPGFSGGVGIHGESGAEWTNKKKLVSSGLHFLLDDVHVVKRFRNIDMV